MRRDLACYIYISNTLPPTHRHRVRSRGKKHIYAAAEFWRGHKLWPRERSGPYGNECWGCSILKARLVEMRRRRENLIRDKLNLCTYFSLWDHLERGAEMKSSVIWQSYLSA